MLTLTSHFVSSASRVIKTIANAVGDLNITENLSTAAAAAIHAKCLICDKPVIVNRPKTAAVGKSRDANAALVVSSSTPLLGYSKMMDHTEQRGNDQDGMFNRLTSKNDKVSRNERLRISADLNILRTTIDPLPDIHVRWSTLFLRCVYGLYKPYVYTTGSVV